MSYCILEKAALTYRSCCRVHSPRPESFTASMTQSMSLISHLMYQGCTASDMFQASSFSIRVH